MVLYQLLCLLSRTKSTLTFFISYSWACISNRESQKSLIPAVWVGNINLYPVLSCLPFPIYKFSLYFRNHHHPCLHSQSCRFQKEAMRVIVRPDGVIFISLSELHSWEHFSGLELDVQWKLLINHPGTVTFSSLLLPIMAPLSLPKCS